MANREEVVKTLARVFVVQEEREDSKNYPYFSDVSFWEDHLQARASLDIVKNPLIGRYRIILRSIDVLSSGRVVHNLVKVIFENGEWISPEHDPRSADPEYREYIRLREKFGE